MDSIEYAAAVAANVSAKMREAGSSVEGMAMRSGIPRSTLDRRLKSGGLSPLTVAEVKAIANVLGVTAASLLTVCVETSTAVA